MVTNRLQTKKDSEMRDLILNRIQELKVDTRFNSHRLFCQPTKRNTTDKIINSGSYPYDYDFSQLSDEQLLEAYERICRWAYKQM